jgi:CRISPR-associated protein Cmr6
MAQIPLTSDVAELIGRFAEGVQNRSLLLDKFIFHKSWPEESDERGRTVKWDDASRWSFIRLTEEGGESLNRESQRLLQQAAGRNVDPDKAKRLQAQSSVARALANSAASSPDIARLRADHTRRFIELFQSSFGDRCTVLIGRLEGRLAINLADSLIQNAGICLDRLSGLPFIPGSAVKGVARHAAMAELRLSAEADKPVIFECFRRVFGTADNDFGPKGQLRDFAQYLNGDSKDRKGAVDFLPAYPITDDVKLAVDLTNVHFPDYYRTGNARDLANERPRLNPFPVVEAGSRFAFCCILNGIDPASRHLEAARRWVETALTVNGLGAKTASGYGWFSIDESYLQQLRQEADDARKAKEEAESAERARQEIEAAEAVRKATMSPEDLAVEEIGALEDQEFALFAKDLDNKTEPEQQAFLKLLVSDKTRRDRWKTWKKKKPALTDTVRAIAEKLNHPPLP